MPHRRTNGYDDRYIEEKFKGIDRRLNDHEEIADERYKEIKEMIEKGLATKVSNEKFKPFQQSGYWFMGALGTLLLSLIIYVLTKR